MENIVKYNKQRQLELMEKILETKGNFRLFCIDVDDVIFNTEPVVQKILERIDYRATKKYREKIARESSEDVQDLLDEHSNILNAILEETLYVEYDDEKEKTTLRSYPQINYEEVYKEENLIPNSIQFVKSILDSRRKNDFVIFLSHMNPEREGIVKTKMLYKLFPEVDVVETLPFHIEPGSKQMNHKALWIQQVYGIKKLDNCYLIDNSRSNCKDFRKHGGKFIRYLQEGFDETNTLADHMSKLSTLDPYMLQFALSFVEYTRKRNNLSYLDKVDISMDEAKQKVKSL